MTESFIQAAYDPIDLQFQVYWTALDERSSFLRYSLFNIHFFLDKENGASTASRGFHMCVGVPASFPRMKNVLLENVRTADNMLVAYKNAMINDSDTIELKAYSHGDKGEEEFITDKRRFIQ